MKQYVTIDKRSKKAQKEYYSKLRGTWGELNPVTRSVPSGKTYNRNKDKQKNRKIGREFSDGFDVDFLSSSLFLYVYENWKSHTPSKSGTLYVDAADGSSYLDLVSLIRMHGATPKKDMQELWKRVLQQDCMKCQRTKPKRNWVRLNIRLKRIGGNLLDNMD